MLTALQIPPTDNATLRFDRTRFSHSWPLLIPSIIDSNNHLRYCSLFHHEHDDYECFTRQFLHVVQKIDVGVVLTL